MHTSEAEVFIIYNKVGKMKIYNIYLTLVTKRENL